MHNITLKVESSTGRSFRRRDVLVEVIPRIGEKVDLGPLLLLDPDDSHHAEVSSVLHTISRFGEPIPPVLTFTANSVGTEAMERVRVNWEELHSMDNR